MCHEGHRGKLPALITDEGRHLNHSGNGAIIAAVEQSPTAGSSKMGEHDEICERFPLMKKESKGIQATKTSQKQT